MIQVHAPAPSPATRHSSPWAGLVVFAAAMLLLPGSLHVLLDVLVLCALTARWDEARPAM